MKPIYLLLLIALVLTACGPKPQDVVTSWAEAMNAGDMDKALSFLAEDAVVTIVPAMEGDGVYNGHAEIRGWYEPLLSSKGVTTLSGCTVDGETITCLDTYADEGLKEMGVDFIEGDFEAVVRDGKIQSYTLTITPESLAKFPPPLPTEVRITSADQIVGKWMGKYLSYTLPHDFRADGLLIVSITGKYVISKGQYWFEEDLLKMNDREGDCANVPGVYEVYATYEGDRPTKLRFVQVGEDACADRRNTLAGGLLAVPPAVP